MTIPVTGNAGHLGEALMRTLPQGHQVIGLDIKSSPFTHDAAQITDAVVVRRCLRGVEATAWTRLTRAGDY